MKLAAFAPRFLLESVEGGERLARYSFIGFGDGLDVRLDRAGLTIGAVYALVSLGVVVIYRISRVVNLAHGAMGIFATFVFHYELVGRLGLPVPVAFVAALGVGAALGVFVERALVGPVRKDGILATLVMTVGVLLVLTELTVQFWGPNQPVIRSIFSDRTIRFAGTGVTVHQLGTAVFVAALGVGLYVLLNRTRYGRAIEAIAMDPGAARIVGLPVRRITTVTWGIGGASAARTYYVADITGHAILHVLYEQLMKFSAQIDRFDRRKVPAAEALR